MMRAARQLNVGFRTTYIEQEPKGLNRLFELLSGHAAQACCESSVRCRAGCWESIGRGMSARIWSGCLRKTRRRRTCWRIACASSLTAGMVRAAGSAHPLAATLAWRK